MLPLSVRILVLEEFRALVSAGYKFTQAIKLKLLLHLKCKMLQPALRRRDKIRMTALCFLEWDPHQ